MRGLVRCNTRRIISYNLGETLSRFLSESLKSSLSPLIPYSTTPFLLSWLLSPSCVWRERKARGKIVSWWDLERDGESLGTIDCRVPWGKSILQGRRTLPTISLSSSHRHTQSHSVTLSLSLSLRSVLLLCPTSSSSNYSTPKYSAQALLWSPLFSHKNKHQSTLHLLIKKKQCSEKEASENQQ